MFKRHPLYLLYLLVIGLVSVGLLYGFGLNHLGKIGFYVLTLTFFYSLFYRVLRNKQWNFIAFDPTRNIKKNHLDFFLLGSIGIFILYHLCFLGQVPFISAVKILDYYQIAFIRQNIIEHDHSFVKYVSAFMIRGIIPFALLYFSITNKKLFFILIPIALFYALSLMQKSLIVSVMIPLIIYSVIDRKYLNSVLYSAIAISGIFILVYTTNPNLRATQEEIRSEMEKNGHLYLPGENMSAAASFLSASIAIYTRVFIATGLAAGYWLDNIPSVYPYTKGCGYRFLAPAIGCDFNDFDYSHIIYNATYKKEAKIGLKGTITVANFVYDYANFGYIGLFYSACITALFFNFLGKIFDNNFKWIISINALFIFWLSSGALHTLLLSGGWIITIILFIIFKSVLTAEKNDFEPAL